MDARSSLTDHNHAKWNECVTVDQVLASLGVYNVAPADELIADARSGRVRALFPPMGSMSTREAVALYTQRATTLRTGKVSHRGLDALLSALRSQPPAAIVAIAGFTGEHRTYVAFLDESQQTIGCVVIEKGDAL